MTAAAGARSFGVARGWRAFIIIAGALIVLVGLATALFLGALDPGDAWPLATTGLALAVLGGWMLGTVLRYRLILEPAAIEQRELLRARRLRRDEIAGRRVVKERQAVYHLLIPVAAGAKPLKISEYALGRDAIGALHAWLATVVDLDAAELARSEAELLKSAALGHSPAERGAALGHARRVAKVANGVAIAVCVWSFVFPHPYELTALLLGVAPWMALILAARSPGIFALSQRRNDARPSLTILFHAPAFTLGFRALIDTHILEWTQGGLLALAGAAVLGVAAARLDRQLLAGERGAGLARWAAFGLLLAGCAYGYGAGMEADVLLDDSAPQVFLAPVIGKHVTTGRSRSYNLRLAPWGPRAHAQDVEVGAQFYEEVPVGDVLCVDLHPGALDVPWFELRRCSPPT